jgi:hypothetical protein
MSKDPKTSCHVSFMIRLQQECCNSAQVVLASPLKKISHQQRPVGVRTQELNGGCPKIHSLIDDYA